MATINVHFAISHRAPRAMSAWRHSMLYVGRRMADKLGAMHNMTAQDRVDHYVARMPIAVLER